jgi:hypothetical protein
VHARDRERRVVRLCGDPNSRLRSDAEGVRVRRRLSVEVVRWGVVQVAWSRCMLNRNAKGLVGRKSHRYINNMLGPGVL